MTVNLVLTILLIILDQMIKLIVRNYHGMRIPIIDNILYFMPTLNKDYSWINSLFQLGLGKVFHIVSVIVFLIFVYTTLKYLEHKVGSHLWINALRISFMSGGICSLIDKIFGMVVWTIFY